MQLFCSKRRCRQLLAIWTCLFCLLILTPAFAGNGDGSGGGQGEPLSLVSANPANHQKGVPVNAQIKLTFNKNVVNMTVRDHNQKCFTLVSSDGDKVPLTVQMADDQIAPDQKRNVVLVPAQALKPGTGYTVMIAPSLQSKSGVTLGKEVRITFTTAGQAAVAAPSKPQVSSSAPPVAKQTAPAKEKETEPAKQPTAAPEQQTPVQSAEKEAASEQPTASATESATESAAKAEPTKVGSTAAISLGLLLAAAGIGFFTFRKMKK